MAAKKKSSNVAPKKKSKTVRLVTYSSIEKLPTEIFHMVLKYLDHVSVMTIQYVSKTLYAQTKFENGQPVIDLRARCPATRPWSVYEPTTYRQITIAVEAKMLQQKSVVYLTCSKCGELKKNNLHGFRDSQFYVDMPERHCLDCWLESTRQPPGGSFKVANRWAICCNFCMELKYTKEQKNKETWNGRICHACVQMVEKTHPKGYLEHVMRLKVHSEGRRWLEKFLGDDEGEDGTDGGDSDSDEVQDDEAETK